MTTNAAETAEYARVVALLQELQLHLTSTFRRLHQRQPPGEQQGFPRLSPLEGLAAVRAFARVAGDVVGKILRE